MALEGPPAPPETAGYEPPAKRVRRHLVRVAIAAATIFLTAWCYQIHIALGIAMTFLAKHILVAILVASLRMPIREDRQR